ncbi:probable LRR receptor-like serine/threonine-protein kinase At1g51880 [Cucurbita pepo subsp. pepo]|uniref:probable LRR receptor-like serine/threonine-protein kinase At1g51880 n=1 Tax=Cucurbita pepo subsp. pepo TaxID=3664 RepID=UPI000C9D2D38|nr:probable LRR receptor-like serine/threonine-protein kinase At1g51880 [Cucurbita pepo subsp. pepo]
MGMGMGMGVESRLASVVCACVCLLAMGFHCRCLLAASLLQKEGSVDGFINIDCGASEDAIGTWPGLDYKSDKYMMDSGMSYQISPELRAGLASQYWSLRSFPNGTRNCYHLAPDQNQMKEQSSSKRYLIRASFVYGDYDGLNTTPIFDLYLGVNFWTTIRLSSLTLDAVTPSSSNSAGGMDYLDVCLVNTGIANGVPYISALELRPLDISLYPTDPSDHAKPLRLSAQMDIGGTKQIRYPQDVFDRYWEGYECDNAFGDNSILVSTEASITESNDDPHKVPPALLQTACRATNSSFPLEYTWTPREGSNSRYYFCFHFAEIEKLPSGQFREMSITFNDVHTITSSIKLLQYLTPQSLCSKGYDVVLNQVNKLSISATSASSLPPILNAIQIFYTMDTTNSLTFSEDVNAIRDIKSHYKLSKNWQGDPCEPPAFSWEGLTCSNNTNPPSWPRIISLNLSNSNLTGDIPASISLLRAINSIDLSYNELKGGIPESLGLLPQLQYLILSGNKLTGVVPETLLQKSKDSTLVLSVEGNPELCWSPPCNLHRKKQLTIPVPIFCGVIAALVLVLLGGVIIMIIYTRRTNKGNNNSVERKQRSGAIRLKNRRYTYLEVVSITEDFRVVIGEGGFGKVFLGVLEDQQTMVAVKVLSPTSQQGYKEFQAEAQLLMVLHHCNLVSLLGYCDEGDHRALIYEYMANGSLEQYVSNRNTNSNMNVLSWVGRVLIAVDVARGLEYLHNGCKPPIIHRDLKPANILLDKTMHAKIADFGLSRTFLTENQSRLLTRLAGTPGYLDPITHTHGNVNKQSDVYSFGIIMLELITGQPAVTKSSQGNFYLLNWVESVIRTGDIEHIVDSKLGGDFDKNSAWKIIELAMSCTQPNAVQRPDMSHVLEELKECLAVLQSTSTQTRVMSTRVLSESEIAPSPR